MKRTIAILFLILSFMPQLLYSENRFSLPKIKKQIAKDKNELEEIFREITMVINYERDCTNLHILNNSRESFWTFSQLINLDNLIKEDQLLTYYYSVYTWFDNKIKSANQSLRNNHTYIENSTLLYLIDKWIKRTNEMKNSYNLLNLSK